MSILKEWARERSISGLRLKRKIGDTIVIEHRGEVITLQIVRFESGFQVVIALEDKTNNFNIFRGELFNVG